MARLFAWFNAVLCGKAGGCLPGAVSHRGLVQFSGGAFFPSLVVFPEEFLQVLSRSPFGAVRDAA